MDRRRFVRTAGFALPILGVLPDGANVLTEAMKRKPKAHDDGVYSAGEAFLPAEDPDYVIHIGTGLVEVAPQRIISTTTYNGKFPGPLLRFTEGKKTTVDIYNDTDRPEQLHWHGQFLSADVDGAAEEGTPYIPAHGMRREVFIPRPAGLRFYHTHTIAGADLSAGQYSGQVGVAFIQGNNTDRGYDREEFLLLKEFDSFFMRGGDMASDFLSGEMIPELMEMGKQADQAASSKVKGYEVGYKVFTINGKQLGHGPAIQVNYGERIMFHIVNGSGSEIRSLALPGHSFTIIEMDGFRVPRPATVPVLWLGTAERISAVVEMKNPGVWILGDLDDEDRGNGMGMVVQYSGHKGKPVWIKPKPFRWDYARFGNPNLKSPEPDQVIDMLFAKQNAANNGFNRWTINGVSFDMMTMKPMFHLKEGRRYRIRMRNASDDIHPMHLHRHSFEITKIGGKDTAGLIKDVVMLGGFQELEVDFVADNPGPSLFHCHMQLHMDFGFMALFDYQ
jgi:FtsP/CotA-like multicopper oxidase with cupredoxin domain